MLSPARVVAALALAILGLVLASHAPRACAHANANGDEPCWQYHNDVRRYACPVNFRIVRTVGALLVECAPCAQDEIADGNGRECHACAGSWFIRPSRRNFFTQLSVGNDGDGRVREFGRALSVRGQVFECR